MNDVRCWMLVNKLKLNDNKTEVLHFSSQFCSCCQFSGITIGDVQVEPATCAKTLGVTLDSHLNLDKHLSTISRSSMASLSYIGRLRRSLDRPSVNTWFMLQLHPARYNYSNIGLYSMTAKHSSWIVDRNPQI